MSFLTLDDIQIEKEDMSVISEMKLLNVLEIRNMEEKYLNKIGDLPSLEELHMGDISLTDGFTVFGKMDNLERISFASTVDSVEGLDKFPALKTIECSSYVWSMIKKAYPDAGYEWEEN